MSATLIAEHDFSDGQTHGWSNANIETTHAGDSYLGHARSDGDVASEQTFQLDPALPSMVMTFEMTMFDSWDNEKFFVELNGEQVSTISGKWGNFTEGQTDLYVTEDGTLYEITYEKVSEGHIGGHANWDKHAHKFGKDATYKVKITAEDAPDCLTVGFGSTLNGPMNNEHFGIDDFKLASTDDTEADLDDPETFVAGPG